MDEKQAIFKKISEEAKDRIQDLEVVSPSVYATVFSDIAQGYDVDLSAEEIVVNEMLDEKLSQFSKMNEQTSDHINQLSKSAEKAVSAIQHKDETLLRETLAETEALRSEIEELKSAVYTDALTKVYNRQWLNANYLEDENTLSCGGVLALIDLNYFKQINDNYGHIAGDKVLVYVAEHLKRVGGQVVRYGGDEFFVLFEDGVTKESAEQKMHVIRELILKKQVKFQDEVFKISFSIGLTNFAKGDLLAEVVEAADVAMYQDKEIIKARLAAM